VTDDLDVVAAEQVRPPREPASRPALRGAIAIWAVAVLAGMGALLQYGLEPGRAAAAPARWPGSALLALATTTPTLVMIAHPRCSCTRASLSELALLTTRLGDRVRTYVLFVRPEGEGESWDDTAIRDRAESLAGVDVVRDDGGREAARLGAATSGQTYLYAPDGRLLFAGGITPMRGHEGDNLGRRRIVAIVESGRADRAGSEVFGCGL